MHSDIGGALSARFTPNTARGKSKDAILWVSGIVAAMLLVTSPVWIVLAGVAIWATR